MSSWGHRPERELPPIDRDEVVVTGEQVVELSTKSQDRERRFTSKGSAPFMMFLVGTSGAIVQLLLMAPMWLVASTQFGGIALAMIILLKRGNKG